MSKLVKYALIGGAVYLVWKTYQAAQVKATALKVAAQAQTDATTAALNGFDPRNPWAGSDTPPGDTQIPGEWDNSRMVPGSAWMNYSGAWSNRFVN